MKTPLLGILTEVEDGATLPASRAWISQALRTFGPVTLLPCGDDLGARVLQAGVTLVYNTCRVPAGKRDRASVVAVLEALPVVTTFADAAALRRLARRDTLKVMLDAHRLPSPSCAVVRPGDDLAPFARRSFPLAIFDMQQSWSATDAVIVESWPELEAAVLARFATGAAEVIIERHMVGEVFGCVVLGNGRGRVVLPPISLQATGPTLEIVPEGLTDGVERLAKAACDALRLRDGARIDIALSDGGVPNIVAAEPIPDLSLEETNPVLVAAASVGMGEVELVQRCVSAAAERAGMTLPGTPVFEDLRYRTPPRGLRLRRR